MLALFSTSMFSSTLPFPPAADIFVLDFSKFQVCTCARVGKDLFSLRNVKNYFVSLFACALNVTLLPGLCTYKRGHGVSV